MIPAHYALRMDDDHHPLAFQLRQPAVVERRQPDRAGAFGQRSLGITVFGGMLAPVKEANRNIVEMRMLAERLAFLATRMQMMISFADL